MYKLNEYEAKANKENIVKCVSMNKLKQCVCRT